MASSQSNCIDARGSQFNHVCGNQSHIYNITINLGQKRSRNGSVDINENGGDEASPKRRKLLPDTQTHIQDVAPQWLTGSAGEVADGLIVKIVQLLIDRGNTDRILELELDRLRQILTLTSLAIQTFKHTPLAQNMGDSVIPEVEHICVVLQGLYDRVDCYWQGLWPTPLRNLWRKVWSWCEVDCSVASLRASQQVLGGFLLALNS